MSEQTGRYTLKHPVAVSEGEGAITEVVIRRALAGDLRAMDKVKGETAQAIVMIARLTGLAEATVDLIDAEDFGAIAEKIGMQLPGGEQAEQR